MRIAFILATFPSLSQTFVLSQITGLLDLGHDVTVFARRSGLRNQKVHRDVDRYDLESRVCHYSPQPETSTGRAVRILRGLGSILREGPASVLNIAGHSLRNRCLPPLSILPAFTQLGPFDVVHCHFGYYGNLGAKLKACGLTNKLVTSFHGHDLRLGLSVGKSQYRRLAQSGDLFLVHSEYARWILESLEFPEEKIVKHSNGVDAAAFTPKPYSLEDTPDLVDGPIRLVTVARLVEDKGIHFGINAVAETIKRRADVRLEYLIVGDGPLKEELFQLVQRLGIEDCVHFYGPATMEEVSEILTESDVFVLPSVNEGQPVALLEAQASGLPVIATNVGGVSEIVEEGVSGFLAQSADVGALSDRLITLAESRSLRRRLGQAGRLSVEKHHDLYKLNVRLVGLYESLLDNRDPREPVTLQAVDDKVSVS